MSHLCAVRSKGRALKYTMLPSWKALLLGFNHENMDFFFSEIELFFRTEWDIDWLPDCRSAPFVCNFRLVRSVSKLKKKSGTNRLYF